MTILAKLQQLEASIVGFFGHLENVQADLNNLKKVLDVAEEVTAIVAPESALAEAVNVADSVVTEVQGVATPQAAE